MYRKEDGPRIELGFPLAALDMRTITGVPHNHIREQIKELLDILEKQLPNV
jgi:hypothetical protein